MNARQIALDALRQLLSVTDCGFSVRYDTEKAIAALEADIAQAVEPGVNQLMAQLHDEQKWTVSKQQQFAQFLKRFPNESSQGIMSLGDAWMHGKACAAPQAVNAQDQQDAQRYRHLRDAKMLDQWIWDALDHTEGDEYSRGLDAAIDAAIAKAGVQQAAEPAVNAWQPIETAPKHTEVLVWREDSGPFIAKLTTPDAVITEEEMERHKMEFPDDFEEWWSDAYGWQEGSEKPTNWMPLPSKATS